MLYKIHCNGVEICWIDGDPELLNYRKLTDMAESMGADLVVTEIDDNGVEKERLRVSKGYPFE